MNNQKPMKNMYLHYRFKFLAVTGLVFLIYIIFICPADMQAFTQTIQFKLTGPVFLVLGILFVLFRRTYAKCPNCREPVLLKKNWECPYCGNLQGKERFLIDKCVHCKQIKATHVCEHCNEEFRL